MSPTHPPVCFWDFQAPSRLNFPTHAGESRVRFLSNFLRSAIIQKEIPETICNISIHLMMLSRQSFERILATGEYKTLA
jgi:hypothetical protein